MYNLYLMDQNKLLDYHMEMGMLLSMAYRGLTRRFVKNTHEYGLDISLDQWIVLGPIWQIEKPIQKDLSKFCLKDKTSITRIVDTLELKGLVVRSIDKKDKRNRIVSLTSLGKKLFIDVVPIMEKTREEFRNDISNDEINFFKQILIKINKNLNIENV